MSKSLGAELMGKMGESWGNKNDGLKDKGDSDELELDMDEDTEDEEDAIQTIITQKKRVSNLHICALHLTPQTESWPFNKAEIVTFSETKKYIFRTKGF
jgi:hypothetical protein